MTPDAIAKEIDRCGRQLAAAWASGDEQRAEQWAAIAFELEQLRRLKQTARSA